MPQMINRYPSFSTVLNSAKAVRFSKKKKRILPSRVIRWSGSFFDVFPHSLVGVKEVGRGLTVFNTYWALVVSPAVVVHNGP